MPSQEQIQQWVDPFADATIKNTGAVWNGESGKASRQAVRISAAFEKRRAAGDEGREALLRLLAHPRKDVRVKAAAHLLRYRTDLAMAVLQEESKGEGMISFFADQAAKRWEEGEWHLDSEN